MNVREKHEKMWDAIIMDRGVYKNLTELKKAVVARLWPGIEVKAYCWICHEAEICERCQLYKRYGKMCYCCEGGDPYALTYKYYRLWQCTGGVYRRNARRRFLYCALKIRNCYEV